MHTVYCDICKKKVENPITNRSFYYIEKFGLCEPCKESVEGNIKSTIWNKDPFSMEWYSKLVVDSIDKGIQKGKI